MARRRRLWRGWCRCWGGVRGRRAGCRGGGAGLGGTVAVVQALGDAGVEGRLWVLTCGAVVAGSDPGPARPAQALVWGLGRTAALEHPGRWGGLVDVPAVLDERAGARLRAVLSGATGEDQVAVRGGGIWGRRLARAPRPRHHNSHGNGNGNGDGQGDGSGRVLGGTVLVTGGTGAIGGHIARWLAGRGAPALVLASRSGPAAPGAAALAAALAGAGTSVQVTACDSARRDQLAGLVARARSATAAGLRGVIHAAGVVDDGLLDGLDAVRLGAVLAAKAGGARYLDELTAGLDLDVFVLCSSAAAVFGGAGQGSYVAANAFLDALARHRRARGLAGLSLAWGPWAGGGLAQASEVVRRRLGRGPLPPMDPALAVRALGQALQDSTATLAVMDVDWTRFGAAGQVPLLRDLPETRQLTPVGAGTAGPLGGELTRQLAGLAGAEQDRLLTGLVQAGAAQVLGHHSAEAIS